MREPCTTTALALDGLKRLAKQYRRWCISRAGWYCASEDKIGSSNQIGGLQAVAEDGASWFFWNHFPSYQFVIKL